MRNQWIIPYGAALLAIVLLALGIFYFAKGSLGHEHPDGVGPRRIERFTPFERAAHWSNAIAFVLLGVSGIIMAFGKFFLLPVIGQTLFGYLTYLLKNIHNFAGPLFAVSLLVMIVTFARDNLPKKGDLKWLLHFGGMTSKNGELPSHRFNAGEKVVFWLGVVLFGLVVAASGLVLDRLMPGMDFTRGQMQVAHMVHNVSAVLMLAIMFGHIYIGSIGMRGAYTAMRRGYVDEAWAREHHAYWYEDIKAGRIPAERTRPLAVVHDTHESARPA